MTLLFCSYCSSSLNPHSWSFKKHSSESIFLGPCPLKFNREYAALFFLVWSYQCSTTETCLLKIHNTENLLVMELSFQRNKHSISSFYTGTEHLLHMQWYWVPIKRLLNQNAGITHSFSSQRCAWPKRSWYCWNQEECGCADMKKSCTILPLRF